MLNSKRSLKLISIEAVVTKTLLSMPIMTPFFRSLGMNQGQIGLSQTIFTVVMMLLDVPMGWVADKFSRKYANVIGDIGCALALILYVFWVECFAHVVVVEILFGISMSLSHGVDGALIKAYSDEIDVSGKLFKKRMNEVAYWGFLAQIVILCLGSPIGAISHRLAIGVSAVTYMIAAGLSLVLEEPSERLVSRHRNPLKDMLMIAKQELRNKELRWRVIALVVGREITHGMIWALTPLLMMAGVPEHIVSVGWVFNCIVATLATKLAQRYSVRMKDWQAFGLPVFVAVVGMTVMLIHFNIVTVWLYVCLGFCQGWVAATMPPMTQRYTAGERQTTMVSITGAIGRILYAPAGWIIGMAGNVNIKYTLLATLIIFVPLALITVVSLAKLEKTVKE